MGKDIYHQERMKKQVLRYSALASALVASTALTKADIVLKDNSVVLTNDGETFEVDLNFDGLPDAKFTFNRNSIYKGVDGFASLPEFSNIRSASLSLMGGASVVYTSTVSGTGNYMGGLFGLGKMIDNSFPSAYGLGWSSAGGPIGKASSIQTYIDIFTSPPEIPPSWALQSSGSTFRFSERGEWAKGITNRYFGVRMEVASGDTAYGWIKVRTLPKSGTLEKLWSIAIDDFALSDEINTGVAAGIDNGTADEAFAFTIVDQSDLDNGSDLSVRFILGNSHASTGEIKLFAVPLGTEELNIEKHAWSLLKSPHHILIDPTTGNDLGAGNFEYLADFGGIKDIYGDDIVNGKEYFVYAYSRGSYHPILNSTGANRSSLVKSSNSELLQGIAEPVTMLDVQDISDNINATDLQVRFKEPADTSKHNEYRIYVVKSANASAFDLVAADLIPASNYLSRSVVDSNAIIQVNYSIGDLDVDGDSIVACEAYRVFVHSVADGVTSDRGSLVSDTEDIILLGATSPVLDIKAKDISDHQDGRDLFVEFYGPEVWDNIALYCAIAVPTADMPISLQSAESVPNSSQVLIPNNGPFRHTASFANVLDYNGNTIQNGVEYTIVVVSKQNGNCVNRSSMAASEETITLQTIIPEVVDSLSIVVEDIANDRSPSDMQVTFEVLDTTGIEEFVVVVANKSFADQNPQLINDHFGTQMAYELGYATTRLKAEGPGTYTTRLFELHYDELGDIIRNYREYVVYILSGADQDLAFENKLSGASAPIILRDNTGMSNQDGNNQIKVTSFKGSIWAQLNQELIDETGQVILYNSQGQFIRSKNLNTTQIMFNNINESGIYFLTFLSKGQKITKKILVE